MSTDKVKEIANALERLSVELDSLESAGEGIPAVEKNVVRMRGAMNVLNAQFLDLAKLLAED